MKISFIQFSVQNFRIFKNKVTFSMVYRKNKDKVFESNGEQLLKTSLIYGPNASGKSTLLEAVGLLKQGIKLSANNSDDAQLPYVPYSLVVDKERPSFFEIVFSLDEQIFRYNFSIFKKCIFEENLAEELDNDKIRRILSRKKQDIKLFGEFKLSEDVISKTRENVLFISAAAQWNNALAIKILKGMSKINIIDNSDSDSYRRFSIEVSKNAEIKKKILLLLKRADFNISDIKIQKQEIPAQVRKIASSALRKVSEYFEFVSFSHKKFNLNQEEIGTESFDFGDESQGTQRFFDILGPITDTLEKGKVLFIDELDNSLHPDLTRFIIELFEKENPNNAQLIATTHDTSLIGRKGEFLRSQIWFTARDKFSAGDLFSLEEFKEKDLRNDTEFQKKYLDGRFGALPFIEHFEI